MRWYFLLICVGSRNPAKVSAVKQVVIGFRWTETVVEPYDVPSGVRPQPLDDEETIKGAINRAQSALKVGRGDIGIGLEGGIHETPYGMFVCNWGAAVNNQGLIGIGGGARMILPETVAERIRAGEELGTIMDDIVQRVDVKKKEGAIGIFTDGFITRDKMFSEVVACALAPYQQSALYNFYKRSEEIDN